MSANGSIMAVGATRHGENAGQIQVFQQWTVQGNSSWEPLGQSLNGTSANQWFGWSLALSSNGMVCAGGAWGYDNNGLTDHGQVRVLVLNNTSSPRWIPLGQPLEGTANNDQFGISNALSADGQILAVGANAGEEYVGYVQVYELQETDHGDTWLAKGSRMNGSAVGDHFGYTVDLSDTGLVLAIGSPYKDGANGIDSGCVYVYQYDWILMGDIIQGSGVRDYLGHGVSLSSNGRTVSVGAPQQNKGDELEYGYTQIFDYNDTHWVRRGGAIWGQGIQEHSGKSVKLSSNGQMVAIGSPDLGSGHIGVFWFDPLSNEWVRVGGNLQGENNGDRFGLAVAISGNGGVVAGGGYFNDGNGERSGHVRVFGRPPL